MPGTDLTEQPAPLLKHDRDKGLAPADAMLWLRSGWADLVEQPGVSIIYGCGVFMLSVLTIAGLFFLAMDYLLLPAMAGFIVVGPLLALGLYQKSRLLEARQTVALSEMVFVKPLSGAQVLFTGVILCGLVLLWMRAAVIIYALFFGLHPFAGIDEFIPTLFLTWTGWAMLFVGSCIGALFAAFSFAISTFSIPMLLDEKTDAFTAMGTSISLVWNNLPVMIAWGCLVLGLTLLGLATAMIGLIVVFPLLGHATWHAYKAIR
ncbi:DUF2189 domain-containing protein [Pelagibius sp. Alg239-R121]|uniref:DUF2189 domain-containing protein n=1 Tax=Pelagibius sp. Alg239-R121 TaxID=2993448 RepID=UPI0024A794C5|nr:DUF2189 domain-containing protein [Pelagibius sp. Alg239-R121]